MFQTTVQACDDDDEVNKKRFKMQKLIKLMKQMTFPQILRVQILLDSFWRPLINGHDFIRIKSQKAYCCTVCKVYVIPREVFVHLRDRRHVLAMRTIEDIYHPNFLKYKLRNSAIAASVPRGECINFNLSNEEAPLLQQSLNYSSEPQPEASSNIARLDITQLDNEKDKFKIHGFLGVEYVVQINRASRTTRYECGLCEVYSGFYGMQKHLLGFDHQFKFCEKHFPAAIRKFRGHIVNVPKYKHSMELQKLAHAIERYHGRKRPLETNEVDFKYNRVEILKKVCARAHDSEMDGPNFEYVFASKASFQQESSKKMPKTMISSSANYTESFDDVTTTTDNNVKKQFENGDVIYGFIGVEYVVKLCGKNVPTRYVCILCNCRFNVNDMQQHLLDYSHRLQYCEKHFPSLIRKYHQFIRQYIVEVPLDEYYKVMTPVLQRLAEAIESQHGRLQPLECSPKLFKEKRSQVLKRVYARAHASEKNGPAFTDVVSIKDINMYITKHYTFTRQAHKGIKLVFDNRKTATNCADDFKFKEQPEPPKNESRKSSDFSRNENLASIDTCNSNVHVDQNKVYGFIGVEYVVKICDENMLPRYECGLCERELSFSFDDMQRHLLGYGHRIKYCEKHFPTVLEQYRKYIRQYIIAVPMDEYCMVLTPVLKKLAEAIEKHHGRAMPLECSLKRFKEERTSILEEVAARSHVSEKDGPAFTDVVGVKDVHLYIIRRDNFSQQENVVKEPIFDCLHTGQELNYKSNSKQIHQEQRDKQPKTAIVTNTGKSNSKVDDSQINSSNVKPTEISDDNISTAEDNGKVAMPQSTLRAEKYRDKDKQNAKLPKKKAETKVNFNKEHTKGFDGEINTAKKKVRHKEARKADLTKKSAEEMVSLSAKCIQSSENVKRRDSLKNSENSNVSTDKGENKDVHIVYSAKKAAYDMISSEKSVKKPDSDINYSTGKGKNIKSEKSNAIIDKSQYKAPHKVCSGDKYFKNSVGNVNNSTGKAKVIKSDNANLSIDKTETDTQKVESAKKSAENKMFSISKRVKNSKCDFNASGDTNRLESSKSNLNISLTAAQVEGYNDDISTLSDKSCKEIRETNSSIDKNQKKVGRKADQLRNMLEILPATSASSTARCDMVSGTIKAETKVLSSKKSNSKIDTNHRKGEQKFNDDLRSKGGSYKKLVESLGNNNRCLNYCIDVPENKMNVKSHNLDTSEDLKLDSEQTDERALNIMKKSVEDADAINSLSKPQVYKKRLEKSHLIIHQDESNDIQKTSDKTISIGSSYDGQKLNNNSTLNDSNQQLPKMLPKIKTKREQKDKLDVRNNHESPKTILELNSNDSIPEEPPKMKSKIQQNRNEKSAKSEYGSQKDSHNRKTESERDQNKDCQHKTEKFASIKTGLQEKPTENLEVDNDHIKDIQQLAVEFKSEGRNQQKSSYTEPVIKKHQNEGDHAISDSFNSKVQEEPPNKKPKIVVASFARCVQSSGIETNDDVVTITDESESSADEDQNKIYGFIGVEYVLKLCGDNNEISYKCCLCELNLGLDDMQRHLLAYGHRIKYCEKHFSTFMQKCRQKLVDISVDEHYKVMIPLLQKLAEAIEKHYGRAKPLKCRPQQYEKDRIKVLTKLFARFHASEKNGPAFTDVVSSGEILSYIAKRHAFNFQESIVKTPLFDDLKSSAYNEKISVVSNAASTQSVQLIPESTCQNLNQPKPLLLPQPMPQLMCQPISHIIAERIPQPIYQYIGEPYNMQQPFMPQHGFVHQSSGAMQPVIPYISSQNIIEPQPQIETQQAIDDEKHKRMVDEFLRANNKISNTYASRLHHDRGDRKTRSYRSSRSPGCSKKRRSRSPARSSKIRRSRSPAHSSRTTSSRSSARSPKTARSRSPARISKTVRSSRTALSSRSPAHSSKKRRSRSPPNSLNIARSRSPARLSKDAHLPSSERLPKTARSKSAERSPSLSRSLMPPLVSKTTQSPTHSPTDSSKKRRSRSSPRSPKTACLKSFQGSPSKSRSRSPGTLSNTACLISPEGSIKIERTRTPTRSSKIRRSRSPTHSQVITCSPKIARSRSPARISKIAHSSRMARSPSPAHSSKTSRSPTHSSKKRRSRSPPSSLNTAHSRSPARSSKDARLLSSERTKSAERLPLSSRSLMPALVSKTARSLKTTQSPTQSSTPSPKTECLKSLKGSPSMSRSPSPARLSKTACLISPEGSIKIESTRTPARSSKTNRSPSPVRLQSPGCASNIARSPESRPADSSIRKLPDIWRSYCRLVDHRLEALNERFKHYKANPDSHPSYTEEWLKFWERRRTELKADGKDCRMNNIQPEWRSFFGYRLAALYEEACEGLKMQSREELSLPFTNEFLVEQKYFVRSKPKENKSEADIEINETTSTHIHEPKNKTLAVVNEIFEDKKKPSDVFVGIEDDKTLAENDKTPNLISVLRLLSALEEHLGSLAPKIVDLLTKVLQAEKTCQADSLALINVENCTLLEMIREKFKGLIMAGLVDKVKERALNKAIDKVTVFVDIAKPTVNLISKQKTPILQPVVDKTPKTQHDFEQSITALLIAQGKTHLDRDKIKQLATICLVLDKKKRTAAMQNSTNASSSQCSVQKSLSDMLSEIVGKFV